MGQLFKAALCSGFLLNIYSNLLLNLNEINNIL